MGTHLRAFPVPISKSGEYFLRNAQQFAQMMDTVQSKVETSFTTGNNTITAKTNRLKKPTQWIADFEEFFDHLKGLIQQVL